MSKGEDVRTGDLIMWVSRDGNRYFGKVIGFTYYGRPIARRIEQPSTDKPLRYTSGREVPDNWTLIAYGKDSEARTVVEMHPITKARVDFAELEGGSTFLFRIPKA